jgi:translation initiation factor 2 beta subunit (eIF-2beta)/eIF-5
MDSLKLLELESLHHPCRDWAYTDEGWKKLWFQSVQPTLKEAKSWNLETRQRMGLEHLLSAPWFKRVWILQEVSNAKSAVVCSGGKFVSARIFTLAPFLLGVTPEAHCQAVLDIMPGPSRKHSWWSQSQDLFTLLLKFRASQAGDPRDKIYALLGISSDAKDCDSLRPDYTKTLQEVMLTATSFLFHLAKPPLLTLDHLFDNIAGSKATCLGLLLDTADVNLLDEFLGRHGRVMEITEELLVMVLNTKNRENGERALKILLRYQECPTINSDLVALISERFSPRTLQLVLAHQTDFVMTIDDAEAAVGRDVNRKHKEEAMQVLLEHQVQRSTITFEIICFIALSFSPEIMAFLLKRQGDAIQVTTFLLRAAMRNDSHKEGMLRLLLEHQANRFEVTESLVEFIALYANAEVMNFLFKSQGDKIRVTENVLIAAATNREHGADMIESLFRHRANELQVTEKVLTAATSNRRQAIVERLISYREHEVRFTKEAGKWVLFCESPFIFKFLDSRSSLL